MQETNVTDMGVLLKMFGDLKSDLKDFKAEVKEEIRLRLDEIKSDLREARTNCPEHAGRLTTVENKVEGLRRDIERIDEQIGSVWKRLWGMLIGFLLFVMGLVGFALQQGLLHLIK